MKKLSLVLFLIVLAVTAQAETIKDPALTVNTEGNTYFNELLGLRVEKPADWYSQSAEEMLMSQREGSKVLAGDNKNMRALLEAAAESSLPLFGFYEYPPGTPGKLNPNVLSVAENIKMYPGIKTPCDYIEAVKSLLQQGELKYVFKEDCKSAKIGGRETGYLDASLELGKLHINQRYYSVIKNGYAISFIQTYTDEETQKKVDQVIDSIVISQ